MAVGPNERKKKSCVNFSGGLQKWGANILCEMQIAWPENRDAKTKQKAH